MRILTGAESRALDAAAIEELGIPGLLLMEHAARAVADAARSLLAPGGTVVVIAGGGNNGGDGYAAARLLVADGLPVRVIGLVEPSRLQGDAATNAEIFSRLGAIGPWADGVLAGVGKGDVIVDAIFGTGLTREPAGDFASAIDAINQARRLGAKVVAVDVPSGLSADTGQPLGAVVRADATITFAALKRGLAVHPGVELAGTVQVAPISIPPALFATLEPEVRLLDEAFVRGLLPSREHDTHKGTFGHCLVVAGSFGKSGAAALSGRAALVGGAGLITVAARAEVVPQILAHSMESMGVALPGQGPLGPADGQALLDLVEGKDTVLVGPGIPRGAGTGELLAWLLARTSAPFVLDADALNALAGQVDAFLDASAEVVVTPHPAEMGRLAGISTAEVQADRIGVAQAFARGRRCTVVLKGARTVIADPDGSVAICPTGNAGMATAGSGDVLGGLIAALLANGLPAAAAARVGVYVHGLAGDRRVLARGQAGLVAGDLIDGVAEVWAAWSR